MYLKKLELIGFKSFANKTTLEFPGGVAAIVGPNGSGKSNIIDSIRWLLGEREAKQMRGAKAEDLIFAGTPKRPRVGVAQASITFDNSQNFFPVDFKEVTVRRRVDREGNSSYFLNDAEVRLKDIIDFFAKSRLGTRGFTIINQGDSDLFVRATPKERRSMLEEILGLRQYQLKKHDAELKLKATNFNIEKVKALIEELMPHLRLLRKQATKWERHGMLVEELRRIEDVYFGAKMEEIEADVKALDPRLHDIEKKILHKEEEYKTLQKELRATETIQPKEEQGHKAKNERKDELFVARSVLLKELGRVEVQIEMAIKQPTGDHSGPELVHMLEETRETVEDILLEPDSDTIKELLENLFKKLNTFLDEDEVGSGKNKEKQKLENALEDIKEKLEKLDNEIKVLKKSEDEEAQKIENFRDSFTKAFAAVEQKKDEIIVLQNEKNNIAFDRERIAIRREEIVHQLRQIGRKPEEFQGIKKTASDDLATFERKMLRLRGELAVIGEIDEGLLKEAKETETRYEFLSNQLVDLEKACADLKQLVRELDQKIHIGFTKSLQEINDAFERYFRMMFQGGNAHLTLLKAEPVDVVSMAEDGTILESLVHKDEEHAIDHGGIEIKLSLPGKRLGSLDVLSGGEKSLVSLAVLFALISVSPPPFLVLDEVDAALDEANTKRFANLVKEFAKKTQFLIVTHNRATMEAASVLYGVTMDEDGTSKLLSLKLE